MSTISAYISKQADKESFVIQYSVNYLKIVNIHPCIIPLTILFIIAISEAGNYRKKSVKW